MRQKFRRVGKFYVYIVECVDGSYYAGYTPNLEKRIELHNNGKGAKYTRDRRPVELVWHKEYKYFKKAFLEEKRIKKLSREQKEKLVNVRKYAGLKTAEKSLAKSARHFSGQSPAWQPKVFIKTLGWPFVSSLQYSFFVLSNSIN